MMDTPLLTGKVIAWIDAKIYDSALKSYLDFEWLLDLLKDWFFWCLQQLIDFSTYILNLAAELMPTFEFAINGIGSLNYDVADILSYIAWIFPFDVLAYCIVLISANYAAYFLVGPALRWLRVIT